MVVFQVCLLLPFSSLLLLLHPVSPSLEGMGAAGATPARYRGGSTHPPPLPQWSDLGTSYFVQGALSAPLTPVPFPSFVVVQSLSRVQLFATPWTAAHQASLSFTISQSVPKLTSIESVRPSNHLALCRPLLLPPSIFPSTRVFSNDSALCIRWPKHWSFSFSII